MASSRAKALEAMRKGLEAVSEGVAGVSRRGHPMDTASRMKRSADQMYDLDLWTGSPRDIKAFNPDLYGSTQGYYGPHNYMSDNPRDVSVNYAGTSGPDLNMRIAREAEQLTDADDFLNPEYMNDAELDNVLDYLVEDGVVEPRAKSDWFTAARDDPDSFSFVPEFRDAWAQKLARDSLGIENEGVMYPLKVRSGNMVTVGYGNDDTKLLTNPIEMYDETLDEYVDDPEGLAEWERLAGVLDDVLYPYGASDEAVQEVKDSLLMKLMDYGEVGASDLEEAIRKNNIIHFLVDDYTGETVSPGTAIAEIYKGLGFDTIKMNASAQFGPSRYWPGMEGLDEPTAHYIKLNNKGIRSRFAEFNPEDIDDPDLTKAEGGYVDSETQPDSPWGVQRRPVMFVGRKGAKRAGQAMEDAWLKAGQLWEQGVDPEEIWRETGWGVDKLGNWYSELDDRDLRLLTPGELGNQRLHKGLELGYLKVKLQNLQEMDKKQRDLFPTRLRSDLKDLRAKIRGLGADLKDSQGITARGTEELLGQRLKYAVPPNEVTRTYPELEEYVVRSGGSPHIPNATGAFYPLDKRIDIYATSKSPRGTLIHEVQHAIQELEGLPGGSSLQAMKQKGYDNPGAAYMKQIGEVQARNADKRKLMDKRYRRNLPPERTEDISRWQQFSLDEQGNRLKARDPLEEWRQFKAERGYADGGSVKGKAAKGLVSAADAIKKGLDDLFSPEADVERLARADKQKFNLPAWHWSRDPEGIAESGSFAPFSHFGTKKAARERYERPLGTGLTFGQLEARKANPPAEGATFPVYLNSGKVLDIGADTGQHDPVFLAKSLKDAGLIDEDVFEDAIRESFYSMDDDAARRFAEKHNFSWYEDEFGDNWLDNVREEGPYAILANPGVDADEKLYWLRQYAEDINQKPFEDMIRNVLDEEDITALRYLNDVEDAGSYSYIVPDPKNVRSINAQFDPKKRNSADILAGVGAGSLLGLERYLLPQDEE